MATITQTPYGTYTHGVPTRNERAGYRVSWYRTDRWMPSRPMETSEAGMCDRVWCAGKHDDSPIHLAPYSSDCACCWLGHAHTSVSHEQHLQALAQAREAHKKVIAIP